MKKHILGILLALLVSGGAFAQINGDIVAQSANVERQMFENKQNGLDKYDGLEIAYLVKVDGFTNYSNEDLPKLQAKLAGIENFKSVEIDDVNSDNMYIITEGKCQSDNLINSLQNQGFIVKSYAGEIRFTQP
mgnify:CR=1 FL=1